MNIAYFNSLIEVESALYSSEFVTKKDYSDAAKASVPDFIANLSRLPYDEADYGRIDISGDSRELEHKTTISVDGRKAVKGIDYHISVNACLQTSSLLIQDVVESYQQSYRRMMDAFQGAKNYCLATGIDASNLDAAASAYLDQYCAANLEELEKRQILVGSPTLHHGCSDGDYFNHSSTDSNDPDNLIPIAIAMGNYFKNNLHLKRAESYTLPLGTSQGVICKTSRDSPKFRAFSKAIQGRYAQLCSNEDELYELVTALDDLFESKGYDRFSTSFFLGKRKQHARKPELVDSGESNMSTTMHYQGRVRGIFPPPELFKVYYKPYCDGVKKKLFLDTEICNVDESKILGSLKRSFEYFSLQLSKGQDPKMNPFYDLSAYDRNTNYSLGFAYQTFLHHAFDDFDKREGINFTKFHLLFPESCDRYTDIMIQEIKNRCTLSGQPDVTIKNNIVHLIMLTKILSELNIRRGGEPVSYEVIIAALLQGGSFGKISNIDGKIHGDDAFLFFDSMSLEEIDFIHDRITDLGVPCAPETAQVYLKKVLDITQLCTGKTPSRMVNIVGSVFRNRFGEYLIKDPFVGMIGFIDTFRKLCISDRSLVENYWKNSLIYYYDIIFASDFLKPDDIALIGDLLGNLQSRILPLLKSEGSMSVVDDSVWNDVLIITSKIINIQMRDKGNTANSLRHFLSRLYYANQEQFDVDDLAELYGSLHYSSEDLAADEVLSAMSRIDIMNLILEVQEGILDNAGRYDIPEQYNKIGNTL